MRPRKLTRLMGSHPLRRSALQAPNPPPPRLTPTDRTARDRPVSALPLGQLFDFGGSERAALDLHLVDLPEPAAIPIGTDAERAIGTIGNRP